MAEIAPAGKTGGAGMNRTFLLIAGGLVALLVLGVIAAGVLVFLPGLMGPKAPVAGAVVTATRVAIAPTGTVAPKATATTAATATTVAPTAVAAGGFMTATPVTNAGTTSGTGTTELASSTKAGEATGASTELPSSGLGDSLLLLLAGVALVAVIAGMRYARAS